MSGHRNTTLFIGFFTVIALHVGKEERHKYLLSACYELNITLIYVFVYFYKHH